MCAEPSGTVKCRKFEPNIFDKTKCQNCFKPKERHSAEALECNKASRKVSKYGYLFVAPESFDFKNPLDKTRKWQWRLFVLYDDGELTYSLDNNVNTVPQGVIDMNHCTDVFDAEDLTGHELSICVVTNTKTVYIKGTNKEEITRWYDVLVMYPRSQKTKTRRTPAYHSVVRETQSVGDILPDMSEGATNPKRQRTLSHIDTSHTNGRIEPDRKYNRRSDIGTYFGPVRGNENNLESDNHRRERRDSGGRSKNTDHHITYRGIRSLKHKHDKSYHEGLRKSNSLHDLTGGTEEDVTETAVRSRSRSGDRFPRRRTVGDDLRTAYSTPTSRANSVDCLHNSYLYSDDIKSDSTDSAVVVNKPKTLFESLLTPDPPSTQSTAKNSRYLKLANIPKTNSIENYQGNENEKKEESERGRRSRRTSRRHVSLTQEDLRQMAGVNVAGAAQMWEAKAHASTSDANLPRSHSPSISYRSRSHSRDSEHARISSSKLPVSPSSCSSGMFDVVLCSSNVSANPSDSHNSRCSTPRSDLSPSPTTALNVHRTIDRNNNPNQNKQSTPRDFNAPNETEEWGMRKFRSLSPGANKTSRSVSPGQNKDRSMSPGGSYRYRSSSPLGDNVHTTVSTAYFNTKSTPPGNSELFESKTKEKSRTISPSLRLLKSLQSSRHSKQDPTALHRTPSVPATTRQRHQSGEDRGASADDSYRTRSPTSTLLLDDHTKNETDERKMAKSGGKVETTKVDTFSSSSSAMDQSFQDDLVYMKKGWLLKQDEYTSELTKHWFVLSGTTLTYYTDAEAENKNEPQGSLNLSNCIEVTEASVARNYGFCMKTSDGELVLSAMTSGIRNNWMQAIRKCISTSSSYHNNATNSQAAESGESMEVEQHGYAWSSSRSRDSASDTSSPGPESQSRQSRLDTSTTKSRRLTTSELSTPSSAQKYNSKNRSEVSNGEDTNSSRDSPDGAVGGAVGGANVSLTNQQQDELDHVERNVRMIHRKSLTEYVKEHKPPQHFEKFETGAVFEPSETEPKQMNIGERLVADLKPSKTAESSSRVKIAKAPSLPPPAPPSNRSDDSLSVTPRRHRHRRNNNVALGQPDTNQSVESLADSVSSNEQSDSYLSPNTRKLEDSQVYSSASSSRRNTGSSEMLNAISGVRVKSRGQSHEGSPATEPTLSAGGNSMNEIIEQKWKEAHVPLQLESVSPRKVSADIPAINNQNTIGGTPVNSATPIGGLAQSSSPLSGGESALVELLETQDSEAYSHNVVVESLRAKLEKTQSDFGELQQQNSKLKGQLRADRKDHREHLNDMEQDQSRYLNQVENIQDQMENSNDHYKKIISEQQAQIKSLKQEMSSSNKMHGDVYIDLKDQIAEMEKTLKMTQKVLLTKDSEISKIEMTKNGLECALKEKDAQISMMKQLSQSKQSQPASPMGAKGGDIKKYTDKIKKLELEISQQQVQIKNLESELQDIPGLRDEIDEKIGINEHLTEDINILKQQLRQQDEQMQKVEKEKNAKIKAIENEFYSEKDKLENQISQLQNRLEQSVRQSSMSDSLNSNMVDILKEKEETVSQLEEKLMESDMTIEKLKKELSMEIDENGKLHDNLDEAYTIQTKLQTDLDQAMKDVVSLETQLNRIEQESAMSSATEVQSARENCKQLEEKLQELQDENETLKISVSEFSTELEHVQSELTEREDELTSLQQANKNESDSDKWRVQFEQKCEDLKSSETIVRQLQQDLQDIKKKQESSLKDKHAEVVKAKSMVDQLNTRLASTEASLKRRSMEVTELTKSELLGAQKMKKAASVKDISLSIESGDVKSKCGELERDNQALKKALSSSEVNYEGQLEEMRTKISELNKKLQGTERRLQRYERRRSTGDSLGSDDSQEEKTEKLQQMNSDLEAQVKSLEEKLTVEESQVRHLSSQILEQRVGAAEQTAFDNLKQTYTAEVDSLRTELMELTDLKNKTADKYESKVSILEDTLGKITTTLIKYKDCLSSKQKAQVSHNDLVVISRNSNKAYEEVKSLLGEDVVDSKTDDEKFRLLAEKLALEAVVLGEMSVLVKTHDMNLFPDHVNVLGQIQEASLLNAHLEQQLGQSSQISQDTPKSQSLSIEKYSRLLSEKMVLQEQLVLSLQDNLKDLKQSKFKMSSQDESAEKLAREALLRSNFNHPDMLHCSVSNRSIVQGDLEFTIEKLTRGLSESTTEKQKVELLEGEINTVQKRLCDKHCVVKSKYSEYVENKLNLLAAVVVKQTNISIRKEKSKDDVHEQLLNREIVHSEFTSMVQKIAELLCPGLYSEGASDKLSVINEMVDKECESCVQKLQELCEKLLNESQSVSMPGEQSLQELSDMKSHLLSELTVTVAQKGILAGNIHWLTFDETQKSSATPKSSNISRKASQSLRRSDSGVIVHSSSGPTSPTCVELDDLGDNLSYAAAGRSQLAERLSSANRATPGSVDDEILTLASKLMKIDSQLGFCGKNGANTSVKDYASVVSREALFQAQLVHLAAVLKAKHKEKLDSVILELSQLKEEYQNLDVAKMEELEAEIDKLTEQLSNSETYYKAALTKAEEQVRERQNELDRKKVLYEQEIQSLKDGYEIRIKSLQNDNTSAKSELEKLHVESEKEINLLEEKIFSLEKELRKADEIADISMMKLEESEKKNHGLETTIRRISTSDPEVPKGAEASPKSTDLIHKLEKDVSKLRNQLSQERVKYSSDYEQELTVTKAAHRRELARSKDEMLQRLATTEAKSMHVDESSIRMKYVKDMDKLKDIQDRGYAAKERSHQKALIEMRKSHKRELDLLRQEKDQLLAEETRATQAALDAMRKAHESELQRERNKFVDMLAKTYSHADVESLQKQHEEDITFAQQEIRQLSEQYSYKCLETAALEERLDMQTRALQDSRKRVQDLMARNEELDMRIRVEIDKLKRKVDGRALNKETKMALEVKEMEVKQLGDEMGELQTRLISTTKELQDNMEKNHELNMEHQTMRKRYEQEIEALKRQLDDVMIDRSDLDSIAEDLEKTGQGVYSSSTSHRSSRSQSPIDSISISSAEASPRLRRSKFAAGAAASVDDDGTRPEVKISKKSSWRSKDPKRAMSNPGPIARFLPSVVPREMPMERRKEKSPARFERHKTVTGIDVSEDIG